MALRANTVGVERVVRASRDAGAVEHNATGAGRAKVGLARASLATRAAGIADAIRSKRSRWARIGAFASSQDLTWQAGGTFDLGKGRLAGTEDVVRAFLASEWATVADASEWVGDKIGTGTDTRAWRRCDCDTATSVEECARSARDTVGGGGSIARGTGGIAGRTSGRRRRVGKLATWALRCSDDADLIEPIAGNESVVTLGALARAVLALCTARTTLLAVSVRSLEETRGARGALGAIVIGCRGPSGRARAGRGGASSSAHTIGAIAVLGCIRGKIWRATDASAVDSVIAVGAPRRTFLTLRTKETLLAAFTARACEASRALASSGHGTDCGGRAGRRAARGLKRNKLKGSCHAIGEL